MKSAGKARNNGLYRHIRTSKEIIRNLLNDLYNNMQNYRTLLFVELIGINHGTLKKMCRQIGIDVSGDKGYDGLVRDYLIKVKVGH